MSRPLEESPYAFTVPPLDKAVPVARNRVATGHEFSPEVRASVRAELVPTAPVGEAQHRVSNVAIAYRNCGADVSSYPVQQDQC